MSSLLVHIHDKHNGIQHMQPEQIKHTQTKTTPLPKTRFSIQELGKITKKIAKT